MKDIKKVSQGLECCNQTQEDWCGQCPYYNDFNGCMLELRQEALALIKEQQGQIESLRKTVQNMMEGMVVFRG